MLRRVWCLEIACDRDPLACFLFASALRIFSRPEGYDAFTLHRPYSKGLIEIDDMGETPDKSPDQLGDNELGESHINLSEPPRRHAECGTAWSCGGRAERPWGASAWCLGA